MGFSCNGANSFLRLRVLPTPRATLPTLPFIAKTVSRSKETNPYESTGITEVRVVAVGRWSRLRGVPADDADPGRERTQLWRARAVLSPEQFAQHLLDDHLVPDRLGRDPLGFQAHVYGSRVLTLLRVTPCQVNENLRTPAEQSRRKTRGVKRLALADDFVRVAKLNRGR